MTDTRELVEALRKIGGHGFPNWADEAANTIKAQAERIEVLEEALALLTVRAGSLVFAHHHGNGLEGWHKVIEGVDCALTQARAALSSTEGEGVMAVSTGQGGGDDVG